VLLQMSLVLLQGLKKPIIRVGRFAGQYANRARPIRNGGTGSPCLVTEAIM